MYGEVDTPLNHSARPRKIQSAAETIRSLNHHESNSGGRVHIQIPGEPSENKLKKLSLIAILFVFCLFERTAHGQQIDAAFGLSTLSSTAGKSSGGLFFPSVGGGAYPNFSADALIFHRVGIEGEVDWRASQNLYGGFQPYRPIFYTFNAIWAPKLAPPITAELLAGIGGENLRFYTPVGSCNFLTGCTNYVSSNHFVGDFGAGIRAYFWRNAFIRPEVRVYLIHNNIEFSSGYAERYGVSLGYSFGGR
jgi:hypothetical protein